MLATPNTIKSYDSFEAKIYVLTKKEGGRHKGFSSNYKIMQNHFCILIG